MDAEIAGLVARNVCGLVRLSRVPHAEMRTLSAEQARTLLQAVEDDRLGALWRVALASGARLGELLALTWRSVDFERGSIRTTRTLTRTARGLEIGEPKTASSRRRSRSARRPRPRSGATARRRRWNGGS